MCFKLVLYDFFFKCLRGREIVQSGQYIFRLMKLSVIPHQVERFGYGSELVMADGGLCWEEVGRGGVWGAHPFRQLED